VALPVSREGKGDRDGVQRVQNPVEVLRRMVPALVKNAQRQQQNLPCVFPVEQHPVADEAEAAARCIARNQERRRLAAAVDEREQAVHQGIDRIPFQDQVLHEPWRNNGQCNQKEQRSPPQRLQLPARVARVEIDDRPVEECPGDEGVVFGACRKPHENRRSRDPPGLLVAAVTPAEISQHGGRREKDHPEVDIGGNGQPQNHRRACKRQEPEQRPGSPGLLPQVPIHEIPRCPPEHHVDKGRQHVVAEGERHEVQKIDVHGEVAELGPGGLEPSAVTDPELRDGQVVDESIAGYRRHQAQKCLCGKHEGKRSRNQHADMPR